MEELRKQVRRAYQRLGFQRFVAALGWSWFALLWVALGLIVVDGFYPISQPTWGWAAKIVVAPGIEVTPKIVAVVAACGWGLSALTIGLLGTAVWIGLTRRPTLNAAIEIDRRFGLKERVSSTLAMPAEELQTEAGQALVQDAVRRVQRVDVPSRFGTTPGKSILLPLLPALAALLVAVLMDPAVGDNSAAANSQPSETRKQVKKSTEALRQRLAERRKQAEKMGLKEAELLFKKLERSSRDIADGKTDREKALTKLNDLARDLKKRRAELGGTGNMKQPLEKLNKIDQGPADKFAKAIRNGDFKKAADELQKLKDKLVDGELSDEDKKKLADQMDQMQKKLQEMADARKAAMDDLKQRAQQMRDAGRAAEANNIEKQLDKLMQQGPQMNKLGEMADQMAQCAQCMRDGQMQDAADAFDKLQAGVKDLQQQLDEMEMLDEAMQQIVQAKDQMNCQECGGMGCKACMGEGDKPGFGLGEGQGQGDRPENENKTSTYESHVKQQLGPGAADVVDLVDGPNIKGQHADEIRQQFDTEERAVTDPLSGRRLPKAYQQQAREYFNRYQGEE